MNKKRLDFIKGQDINYVAYNTLLILFFTKATNSNTKFKDYRILSHLIQIINDKVYLNAFQAFYGKNLSPKGEYNSILKEIYLKSIENNEKIKHILLIMENIGLIELENNEKITSLWINQNNIKEETLKNKIFSDEKENIKKILEIESRIRTNKYATFIERFYKNNGVDIWDI